MKTLQNNKILQINRERGHYDLIEVKTEDHQILVFILMIDIHSLKKIKIILLLYYIIVIKIIVCNYKTYQLYYHSLTARHSILSYLQH